MKARVTQQGVVKPKKLLRGVKEVDIRRSLVAVIIRLIVLGREAELAPNLLTVIGGAATTTDLRFNVTGHSQFPSIFGHKQDAA